MNDNKPSLEDQLYTRLYVEIHMLGRGYEILKIHHPSIYYVQSIRQPICVRKQDNFDKYKPLPECKLLLFLVIKGLSYPDIRFFLLYRLFKSHSMLPDPGKMYVL